MEMIIIQQVRRAAIGRNASLVAGRVAAAETIDWAGTAEPLAAAAAVDPWPGTLGGVRREGMTDAAKEDEDVVVVARPTETAADDDELGAVMRTTSLKPCTVGSFKLVITTESVYHSGHPD